jgi:hypothetical protein
MRASPCVRLAASLTHESNANHTGVFLMGQSADYRATPGDHLFQFSLRSRCTAMLAGLRTFIQTGHGPDR